MLEAKEGRSAVSSSELEGAKDEARTALLQGASLEQVIEESGLNRPTVLGLYGAIRKKAKKISRSEGEPSKNLGEETDLNTDLKKEAQITNNMVVLARGKQRLKSLDPGAYRDLHGPEQAETNLGKLLTDIEFARYLKTLREQESHQNNGDSSSQATIGLQRQIDDLKEALHKKDFEALQKQSDKLEGQIVELRADMRSSTNSNSDLAVIVKESKELLSQVINHDGVLRRYLMPDDIAIKARSTAPPLQPVEARNVVVDALRERGYVTKIVQR
ncbi:hypothetical protein MUP01_07580 [Candidatus Bathyarchaeota archaeon]|nr:hypothetical protein [Candidatus Bathyarchaeota archaeon]